MTQPHALVFAVVAAAAFLQLLVVGTDATAAPDDPTDGFDTAKLSTTQEMVTRPRPPAAVTAAAAGAPRTTTVAAGTVRGGSRRNRSPRQQQQQQLTAETPERSQAGFYTTRFGRSDPTFQQPSRRRQQELQRAYAQTIGYTVEGYDDHGQAVSCVFAGSKGLYICQREQQPEW